MWYHISAIGDFLGFVLGGRVLGGVVLYLWGILIDEWWLSLALGFCGGDEGYDLRMRSRIYGIGRGKKGKHVRYSMMLGELC